jgi:hypothetical protein
MIDSVPAMAPTSPPETGASSSSAPSRAQTLVHGACRRGGDGAHVHHHGARLYAVDDGGSAIAVSKSTCSTSGVSATMVKMIDARRATSAGLRAGLGADRRQRFHRLRSAGMHGQLKTRLDEVEGHGPAHDAEADKADLLCHLAAPSVRLVVRGILAQSYAGLRGRTTRQHQARKREPLICLLSQYHIDLHQPSAIRQLHQILRLL